MFRTGIVRDHERFNDRRLNHADTDAAIGRWSITTSRSCTRCCRSRVARGGTNLDRSDRIGSPIAENLLSLVRYGRKVMDEDSFRSGATDARRTVWAIPRETVAAAVTASRPGVHRLPSARARHSP